MTEMLLAIATCLVCGEQVTHLEAPLHAEDHAQRGEFPDAGPLNVLVPPEQIACPIAGHGHTLAECWRP